MQSSVDKGFVSLQLGDYTMAQTFFSAVLSHKPNHYEARLGMGKALLQQAATQHEDTLLWRQALIHLEAARTLRPQQEHIDGLLSEVWALHGRHLLDGGDTLASLSALSRAIELQPRSVEPLNLVGIIYFRMGDEAKAEVLFNKAATLDTLHPSAPFNLGMMRWSQGDVLGAREQWLRALKCAPRDEDILYWFALAQKEAQALQ
jgi:Flp pilus assembly protein TadD